MKFIMDHLIIDLLALLCSVIALVLSSIIATKGWWKQRTIYGIELCLFLPRSNGEVEKRVLEEKLNSGTYTILHIQQEMLQYGPGPHLQILLGKLKK